jgi:hypothetical protein
MRLYQSFQVVFFPLQLLFHVIISSPPSSSSSSSPISKVLFATRHQMDDVDSQEKFHGFESPEEPPEPPSSIQLSPATLPFLQKRSTLSTSHEAQVVLHSPRESNWGTWSNYVSVCPDEQYVVGMELKTDPFHGNHHNGAVADNTALNGIKFRCSDKPLYSKPSEERNLTTAAAIITTTTSALTNGKEIVQLYELDSIRNEVQKWGKWGSFFFCKQGGYAIGFQMRSLRPLDSGAGFGFKFDDVGACNLRLFCSTGEVLEGDGRNEWGIWTTAQRCPQGQALCSLRTQIEKDQLFCEFFCPYA